MDPNTNPFIRSNTNPFIRSNTNPFIRSNTNIPPGQSNNTVDNTNPFIETNNNLVNTNIPPGQSNNTVDNTNPFIETNNNDNNTDNNTEDNTNILPNPPPTVNDEDNTNILPNPAQTGNRENSENPLISNVLRQVDERERNIQQRIRENATRLNREEFSPKFSDNILNNFTLIDLRIKENQILLPNHLGVVYYKLDDDGKTVIYNQDKYLIREDRLIDEANEIIKKPGGKKVILKKKSWFGGNKHTRRINKHSKTKKQSGSYLEHKKSLSKNKRRKTHRK